MQSFLKCWAKSVCYGNRLIFPSATDNRIVYVDIGTGQIDFGPELLYEGEDNRWTASFYYTGVMYIEPAKVLFVSRNSESFLIFDLKTEEQAKVELKLPDVTGESIQYWENSIYRNKLFLLPLHADYILQFDMDTMQAEKREGLVREIDLFFGKKIKPYFAAKAKYDDNHILLAGWSENFVVRADLDLKNWHIDALKNEGDEKGFRDIMVYGNYIYAVNHRFHVFKYKRDSFEYVKQVMVLKECSVVKRTEAGLCLVPAFEEDFVVCDEEDRLIKRMPYPEEYTFLAEGENVKTNNLLAETDNYYLIARTYGNTIEKVDKKTGEIFYVPLKYGESSIDYAYSQRKIFAEGKRIANGNGLNICADLRMFMDTITTQNGKCSEGSSNGTVIYRNLKKDLCV